jgi:tripartite-type tricarboxylate transporter receptor subunit TctC
MSASVTRRSMIKAGAVVAAAFPLPGAGWAQTWPSRAISMVCAHPAGGLPDLFARAFGDYISRMVGQPVVVQNNPGAGGSLAMQAIVTASPDGHTLMLSIAATIWKSQVLYKNLPRSEGVGIVPVACIPAGNMGYICAVGPAGIPRVIVDRLSALMVEASNTTGLRKLREGLGADERVLGHEEFKKLCAEQGPIWISSIQGLRLTLQRA